jgi:hypothetical protein
MIHIDHISISAANIYEASHRLREETGIGFYDAGFFPGGNANRVFPLGGSTYLEVGGFVDVFVASDPKRPKPWWYEKVRDGDRFSGLCLRVDTLDELKEIADRLKVKFPAGPLSKTKPDGTQLYAYGVPSASDAWPKGLPNWYYFPDYNKHPSGQPVIGTTDLVNPLGISFLEVGGTEGALIEWMGVPASNYPFRFNGKVPGLYAVGVKTEKGEIVIRRKSATED